MSLCLLCVLTFGLVESSEVYRNQVFNSIVPIHYNTPAYNISWWVSELHLQQCVIVEMGETYFGVFVEFRPADIGDDFRSIEEYFVGLCDLDTLRKWKFCSPELEHERPKDCNFQEFMEFSNNPSRVHRRLCDITELAYLGEPCNCSPIAFDGQKLHRVSGFPTCFLSPLPESLCIFGHVCGVHSCYASTVNKIHTINCNRKCLGHQPFCESTSAETARASPMRSYWSEWIDIFADETIENNTFVQSYSICINKNTGMGAIDCLGPATGCCPPGAQTCKCHVYVEEGVMKLARELLFKEVDYQRAPKQLLEGIKPLRNSKIVIRDKYSDKVGDDYEDDDQDMENAEEDVILDEEEEVRTYGTTESLEMSEMRKNEDENSNSTNFSTKPEPKISVFFLLYFNHYLFPILF